MKSPSKETQVFLSAERSHYVLHSALCILKGRNIIGFINPLAHTDVPETAGLARSINTQLAVRRNSETNPTSQHNRGMY